MFNRFTKDARQVVEQAVPNARELGAPSVEAEHLLLAASRTRSTVARVLHDAQLDYDSLVSALDREAARSLAVVGVQAERPRFSPFLDRPRFGASAKLALERSLKVAVARKENHIQSGHIVLAVLHATTGTVPRSLECAEIDRAELISKVERAF
jgi:ATP-dependent Clp protease ATP-binding subunit ClpA